MLKRALLKLGQRYVLGCVVPKDDPDWGGPWDCAEFGSWNVFQETGKLVGCVDNDAPPARADAYTGAWARDAKRLLERISVEEAAGIAGAFLLREPRGKYGHLAMSDGDGGTVEAASTRLGVRRLRIGGRRWDTGLLVPGIDYHGEAQPVTPPRVAIRLTEPRTSGPMVRTIQNRLKEAGHDPGPVDGIYGPKTMQAVADFQKRMGLVVDGEVGQQTARALRMIIL